MLYSTAGYNCSEDAVEKKTSYLGLINKNIKSYLRSVEERINTRVLLFSYVDRFSTNGDLMFTASSDGVIFVIDGRPSKNFAMLGYVCKLLHSPSPVLNNCSK